MSEAPPYMKVTGLDKRLTLLHIECPIRIGRGRYRASVAGEGVEVFAGEPTIQTGSAPLRALELYASGTAVEKALRLEADLRAGGPLHMEAEGQLAFEVTFRGLRSRLYLHGDFQRDRDEPEVPFRIRLGDREIQGIANDGRNDLRRVLAMMELTRDDEAALVKAFNAGWPLVVEQLSW